MSPDLKKELKATLAMLSKRMIDDVLGEGVLDELVHDLKSSEASSINNSGFEAQVEYIYEAMGEDAHNAVLDALDGV